MFITTNDLHHYAIYVLRVTHNNDYYVSFSQCEMMQAACKKMTHFGITRQQFRIHFMPAEVMETVLPITQTTIPLLHDSFRLSLIFIWQMFNCRNDKSNSGTSRGDRVSECDIITHSDIWCCNRQARLYEIWKRAVNTHTLEA